MSDDDRGKISSKEKQLATVALEQFNKAEYSSCLSSLEQLEILRPSDVKLAHNKIVVQCRGEGGQVPLSEVVQQLEGLAKTAGVDLTGTNKEDEAEWTVLTYNLAVAKFQQRHILQASQLAARLLSTPVTPVTIPGFNKRVLFLNAELCLALRQPEQAAKYADKLHTLVEGSNEEESSRLMMLKARCQVLNRQIKSLKKELKSVSLPGSVGVTCEFVRSHIEFQCGNFRKSIKMLNSAVQAAGSRVFPHYYNNLGCIHQNMKKPNLAVYYFKNALERLEASQGGTVVPTQSEGGKESTSWLTQSQVLYNISLALLHAKRPHIAFELLLEVVSTHYLDPHVWFHLAECCIQHHQPDNQKHFSVGDRASQVSNGGVGAGSLHKIVASNPDLPISPTPGTVPVLSLDFAYVCLKNAESLLPKADATSDHWGFCTGVGYIGNPMSWTDVEQLRVAILSAESYVALAIGDFILAGSFAETLLGRANLPGAYKMLAHLYCAESLILQDRLSEAIKHLDPEKISDVGVNFGSENRSQASGWNPSDLNEGRAYIQYNLAVGFALREEWDKAGSLAGPLYNRSTEMSVQVLLLNLYIALRQGDCDRARQLVRDRCPATDYSKSFLENTNLC